jgi:DNA-binding NtrC family response regulator
MTATLAARERTLLVDLLDLPAQRSARGLLERALSIAVQATASDRGYLAVYGPDRSDFSRPRWYIASGMDPATTSLVQASAVQPDGLLRTVVARAIAEHGVISVFKAYEDPAFDMSRSAMRAHIDAILCASIGDPADAVLYLYREQGAAFSAEDRELVTLYRRSLAGPLRQALDELAPVDDPTARYRQNGRFSKIVGRSPALANALRAATVANDFDEPTLLLGPTGSGKTHLARAMHAASARAAEPFVSVSLANMDDGVIERELFGSAPNGSSWDPSEGILEKAGAGTIFLDEVGSLPQHHQARLYTLLDDGTYRPIGREPRQLRARLILAMNQSLDDDSLLLALRTRLRRLARVDVPALSDRRADIPLLLESAGASFADRYHLAWRGLTPAAVEAAMCAEWPGNVRDIETVVRNALRLTGGGQPLTAEVLFPTTARPSLPAATHDPLLPSSVEDIDGWGETRNRYMLLYFRRCYQLLGGDKSEIMRMLQIGEATFFSWQRRMREELSEDATAWA